MTEEHVCEDGGEIIQDHMSSTSTTNWSVVGGRDRDHFAKALSEQSQKF